MRGRQPSSATPARAAQEGGGPSRERRRSQRLALLLAAAALAGLACSREGPRQAPAAGADAERPSILLVTLDTTRADAIGPEAAGVETPAFDALAARGRRFTRAYATAPETLPSHASMLTGATAAEHGVHENGRRLGDGVPLLAERLAGLGYATAAFVSGFPLDRRFGLARGFATYDDEIVVASAGGPAGGPTATLGAARGDADAPADRRGGSAAGVATGARSEADSAAAVERPADATTDLALAWLAAAPRAKPLFLWVHYYDPHDPYAPPPPFAERYAADPYLGEVAFVDSQLARLVAAFEERAGGRTAAIAVAGDHGEGRGEHGEAFHGHLLYEGVMRVPLVLAGAGVEAGVVERPVSLRRLHDTILAWAGGEGPRTLLRGGGETVVAEAMRPYLQYGWQPQAMAVRGRWKAIRAGGAGGDGRAGALAGGAIELYDVAADPGETDDLAGRVALPPELARALADYPLPGAGGGEPAAAPLDDEARRKLASLGYATGSSGRPTLRPGAPSPAEMTHLFPALDLASGLFERRDYAAALPVLERILAADPENRAALLRLAAARSALGHAAAAEAAFERLAAIDPASPDLRHYHALHLVRAGRDEEAAPLLESVLAATPDRLPALLALAGVRERQGRPAEAAALLDRAVALDGGDAAALVRLGELRMATGDTPAATAAFERARALQGADFRHHLELGVLYLAARRLDAARDALDRVPPTHPGHPMALFKRAQVAVLLGEPDAPERIAAARRGADGSTRELIEREPLFRGGG